MTTMSARDLNRDVSAAKRAADVGPVVITERGKPAYVLMSIDEYRRLHGDGADLVARLRMDDDIDIDLGAALLKGPAELGGGPQAVEPADPATCLSGLIGRPDALIFPSLKPTFPAQN